MRKVIEQRLLAAGFTIFHQEDLCSVLENAHLKVAIFDWDYPHNIRRNKVCAEHQENFDKWSKAFYTADMPSSDKELNLIIADLEYISTAENRWSGDYFGRLRRSF